MADPEKAGTPPTEPAVSESAGTTGQAVDGSESAGKPVDPALAMAWKAKAERVNEAERRLAEAEARLAAAQQAQYAQAQATDPMAQMVQSLNERAAYGDSDAVAQLTTMKLVAAQQAENMLTDEMMKARVPPEKWDAVKRIARQNGYRISIMEALSQTRGGDADDLAKQLEAERAKNAALEKALNGQTVNGARPSGNAATTTPAAISAEETPLMDADEYRRLLASLPEAEAKALRDKGVRFKR